MNIFHCNYPWNNIPIHPHLIPILSPPCLTPDWPVSDAQCCVSHDIFQPIWFPYMSISQMRTMVLEDLHLPPKWPSRKKSSSTMESWNIWVLFPLHSHHPWLFSSHPLPRIRSPGLGRRRMPEKGLAGGDAAFLFMGCSTHFWAEHGDMIWISPAKKEKLWDMVFQKNDVRIPWWDTGTRIGRSFEMIG